MRTVFVVLIISTFLASCQFSKSVKKDFVTGLTSSGNVLSCDDIYLTVKGEKVNRNVFTYGEKFFVNFNDIKGFTKENENVFPGLNMTILDMSGDTVLKTDDVYSHLSEGVNYSPLLLTTDLLVATPMHSGNEYVLHILIWDKKADGTFATKLPFTLKANEKISIDATDIIYDEIYLMSENLNKVITDNKIGFNDNIYIIFEGLEGLMIDNGLVYPGLGMKLTDTDGNSILENENLFADYSVNGINPIDLAERVSANFILSGSDANNPLHLEVTLWDIKSPSRIKVSTDLIVE